MVSRPTPLLYTQVSLNNNMVTKGAARAVEKYKPPEIYCPLLHWNDYARSKTACRILPGLTTTNSSQVVKFRQIEYNGRGSLWMVSSAG